jgi:cell fate regulator YaaT (PSP1 superfamily)
MTEEMETPRIPVAVGVSFRAGGKVYHFAPNGVQVSPGDHVLARTERGVDIGEVAYLKYELTQEDAERPLKPLVRRATRDDIRREERLREREKEASAICEQRIAEHKLPMKLVDADYTFDGQRLVFYFSAEGRVDFRALVRDLAEALHCRIELRQIGVRDEAKMIGGLGPCGRPLCCAQWLRTFDPVGIRVAKDQGMPLNPAKISGICDRLMCCLKYEHEVYKELAARLPQTGDEVRSQGKVGRVREVQLLRERVTVDLMDSEGRETVQVDASELRRARGYWLLIASTKAKPFVPTAEAEAEPAPAPAPAAPPPPRGRQSSSSEEPKVIMREPRRGRDGQRAARPAPTETPVESPVPSQPSPEAPTEGAQEHKRPSRRSRRRTPRTEQPQEPTGAQTSPPAAPRPPREPRPRPASRPKAEPQPRTGEGPAQGETPAATESQAGAEGSGRRRQWRRRRPRRGPTSGGEQGGAGGGSEGGPS